VSPGDPPPDARSPGDEPQLEGRGGEEILDRSVDVAAIARSMPLLGDTSIDANLLVEHTCGRVCAAATLLALGGHASARLSRRRVMAVDTGASPVPGAPATSGPIEAHSIDHVPEHDRHGKLWQQAPFWFLGNFQPFTLAIGLIGPGLGLSLGWSALAGVLGILFGTFFMAFHATQGPWLGLPQMIQSRAQLGYRGVLIALAATLFTLVGFNVIDLVILDGGLKSLFGWNATLVGVVITVGSAILAIYGHDWLHRAFRVLFFVSIPFWALLTLGVLLGHAGGKPATNHGFTLVAFMVQFTAAASYNITYAPYVSDYSRYLPRHTPTKGIIASVYAGAAGSPMWLIPLGAWMGSHGIADPLVGIRDTGDAFFSPLGTVLTILAVLALVATMGINSYSAMLTTVTAVDSVRPVRPTRAIRVVSLAVLAVVWGIIGIGLIKNFGTALSDTLILMLYVLAPWTAINLVDYFFVRRGHYAITELFKPRGIYGTWAWRGITAYIVAILAELPFVVLSFAKGPAAKALNEVDISFVIGLMVAGGLYWVLTRSLDVRAEQPVVERSERELATIEPVAG